MKKLVLMLAVAFSVSLFSCGGSDAKEGVDSDSLKKVEDSVAAAKTQDSIAKAEADAAAAAAKDTIKMGE